MASQMTFAYRLVLLVAFILEVPTYAAASMTTLDNMKTASVDNGGFAVDMMQYHHVNSPYAKSNLTLEQRVHIAVRSSLARAQYFHNLIFGETSQHGDKAVYTVPIYGVEGGYIIPFTLGTPPRTYFSLADTGSDLVWVQCAPCQSCFAQPDPIFDPATSSTYQPLPCRGNALCSILTRGRSCPRPKTCLYTVIYGIGFTAGNLASETVTLTTTSGRTRAFPNFAFGCSHNSSDDFAGLDGLVGLGQRALSLVEQLGPQFGNVFSYCLVAFPDSTTRTSPLLLGSPGPVPLRYTPLLASSAHPAAYYVNVVGIRIDGIAVQYPPETFQIASNGSGGLFLDSGTTLTLLDSRVYTSFIDLLQSRITYPQVPSPDPDLDICYNIAGSGTFPVVTFQFENVNVELPPNNLIFPEEDDVVCLAFASLNAFSVFGNVAQQDFQIAYDLGKKRVGIAPRNC